MKGSEVTPRTPKAPTTAEPDNVADLPPTQPEDRGGKGVSRRDVLTRPTLASIALAISIAVSFWIPLGSTMAGWIIEPATLRRMGGTGLALGSILALAALPAAMYLSLRATGVDRWLRVPPFARRVIAIGNAVVLVAVSAIGLASQIEGGGPGYAVRFYAFLPLLAAKVGYVLAGVMILLASGRRSGQARLGPFRRAEGVWLLVACALPWVLLGGMFARADSPLRQAIEASKKFEARCAGAIEEVLVTPGGVVEGIFLERDGGETFTNVRKDGSYQMRISGVLGDALINSGFLLYFEKSADKRRPAGPYQPFVDERRLDAAGQRLPSTEISLPYQRHAEGRYISAVDALQSSYGLYERSLESPDERALGLYGKEIAVRRIPTGELLARTVFFEDRKGRRFCGALQDGEYSTLQFLIRTLGLKKRFPSVR